MMSREAVAQPQTQESQMVRGSSFMHEKESKKSFWSGDVTVIMVHKKVSAGK